MTNARSPAGFRTAASRDHHAQSRRQRSSRSGGTLSCGAHPAPARPMKNPETSLPTTLEQKLYTAVFEHSGEERARVLRELCAKHHEHADTLRELAEQLDRGGALADAAQGETWQTELPEHVGPYRVLEELGRAAWALCTSPSNIAYPPTAFSSFSRLRASWRTKPSWDRSAAGSGAAGSPVIAMKDNLRLSAFQEIRGGTGIGCLTMRYRAVQTQHLVRKP